MRNQLRMLAAVLSAMMVLLLLPAAALAAGPDTSWYSEPGSDGTYAHPYIIHNADELAGLSSLVNGGNSFSGKIIQIAAGSVMDLSAYTNWMPIGSISGEFSGIFDGNNVPISNLLIDDTVTMTSSVTQRRLLGLFGWSNGTIENIVLNAPQVKATHSTNSGYYDNKYTFAGTIAGVNDGTITGCKVTDATVQVSGITVAVGGIAGYNASSTASIADCSVDAQITASAIIQYLYAGGIAGGVANTSTITGCKSEGSVTITAPDAGSKGYVCRGYAGGIVGYMSNATAENSQSESEISVTNGFNYVYAGGLAGYVSQSTVNTCSSSGDVYGDGGEFGTLYEEAMGGRPCRRVPV